MTAPILIFAVGTNRAATMRWRRCCCAASRRAEAAGRVELIEITSCRSSCHRPAITGAVLFVDADMSCAEPFHFSEIAAEHDHSYTGRAMTRSLLHTYRQVWNRCASAFLLRIRGYDFELGNPLNDRAAANLEAATEWMRALCAEGDLQRWRQCLVNA